MRYLPPFIGLLALFAVFFVLLPDFSTDGNDRPTERRQDEIMEHANELQTGDLDSMIERGFLRVLTVHNPLFFTFDGENQQGMVAELAKLFEEHLAEEVGRVRSPTIVLIPVSRNELIPGLLAGRGDLVMGNLTITPERQKLVDFGPPIHTDVEELVITGPAADDVDSLDDLVETGLYVRRSSSYFEHLQALNAAREANGKPQIPITEADENLEDYDLLDMVNAGVLGAIVVDSHKAAFWEQVFDDIEVHRELPVNSGGRIAWAMRKNSPRLMQSVSAFADTVRKGTLLGNIVMQRYLGDTDWLEPVLAGEYHERYDDTIEIIRHYASRYDFDWLIIAAQAYQESRFDQSKRSPAGAIGVMQLMPTTAASDAVGIPNISKLENNVHAGVKYLHWLRETYYSDPAISPLDRVLFSFAAYNAGPGNMKRARSRAKRLGFDPNRWFGNVEIGMYRAVSGEPASYVRNIYKYYVTYQGLEQARRAREKALDDHRR
ncbi:MAG: transglycosylase SLT domain-containing protein [Gammaproteobacteria bacterium]|nr:transglycosylase SLT domain-containing protein [Gammaproteobacteria bacterium]MDH3447533.1 transglycosylase SLT domain-containing protein [Gammaproteobacteria bacterium]